MFTEQDDTDACVKKTVDTFGGILTLVNNVGWISHFGTVTRRNFSARLAGAQAAGQPHPPPAGLPQGPFD
jgi:hypothetical protein